jgi:exonuclease VII small subunit
MADTYDDLFQRLERNVERLQSDEIGLVERLELCRHSRTLAARCADELERIGTEIEELFLDDLLAQVNDLSGDRPTGRRRTSKAVPSSISVPDPEGESSAASVPGNAPELVEPTSEPASTPVAGTRSTPASEPAAKHRGGILATHLDIVARTLRSLDQPVTLDGLVEYGAPATLARLLGQSGAARTPEAVHHVTLLLTDDRVLPSARRALARLARDPEVVDWFDRGLRDGRDVLAELAQELSPPAA